MPDCQFCDIAAGEAPATRLYEDEVAVAFLDIAPVAGGHTLVVPKDHYETLTDMPPETAGDLFERVRTVAEAVETALDPDGLNLVQANGEAAGQEVFHAHVHLLPRYENDDVEVRWPAGKLTEDKAREITTSIRAEFPD